MKRNDGKCEDGFGHFGNHNPPRAKWCIRRSSINLHLHVCGKHVTRPYADARPVAECSETERT